MKFLPPALREMERKARPRQTWFGDYSAIGPGYVHRLGLKRLHVIRGRRIPLCSAGNLPGNAVHSEVGGIKRGLCSL